MQKTALITGATSEIGFYTALLFMSESYRVILTARDKDRLKDRYSGHEKEEVFFGELDISEPESVRNFYGSLGDFGYPDIIINISGISIDSFILGMTEKKWLDVINTNLNGFYRVIKAFVRPMMKKRWGRIINLSSVSGKAGNIGQTNYSASKAGIIGLTLSLAKELAPWNITCNGIAPGLIKTGMTDKMEKSVLDSIISRIPLKRIGIPQEVASLIYFLSQDICSYITGDIISIDGGLYMN